MLHHVELCVVSIYVINVYGKFILELRTCVIGGLPALLMVFAKGVFRYIVDYMFYECLLFTIVLYMFVKEHGL